MIKHLILFVFSIHSKTMATNVIFSWTFDPFFTFFIDCHVYVPNGMFWGSKSRPHIGDLVMSLFLLWGPSLMTGDGLKMFHFGPKMAKHGRLVNVPKWSERVQKGPKWPTQFGTCLGPSGHFWTISDENEFFAPNEQSRVWRRCFGAKNQFLFEMVCLQKKACSKGYPTLLILQLT